MHPIPDIRSHPVAGSIAIDEAVELQDQLFEAATDLDRLGGLLEDATRQLMERFDAVNAQAALLAAGPLGDDLRRELEGAVTALQFQDMAAQVLSHTVARIRGVADFLGARAMADDDEEAAAVVPLIRRHCPVAQRQVDAGSVELF
jgi:hypothetical protein